MSLRKWIGDTTKNKMYNKLDMALQRISANSNLREVDLLGSTFVQFSDVFPIDEFCDTSFFSEVIEVKKDEEFLEIGIGTGATSILVAKQGAIVTGVDICGNAVKNSVLNAKINLVEGQTNFFESDVFNNVPKKKFDTIYWNVPFCYSELDNLNNIEKSVFDFRYIGLERFIRDSHDYLKYGGRLLIGFSNVWGIPEKLFHFLYENGYDNIKIEKQRYVTWKSFDFDLTLYEIKNHK